MIEGAISSGVYTPETYDLSQEPYFYDFDDESLKATQSKLMETQHQHQQEIE